MSKYIKFLSISLLVAVAFAFMQSHRHKLQVVFKNQKELLQQITLEGKPNLKQCYIQKGEVLGVRQMIAHTKLHGTTEANQKAFFINAYNFAVIAELNERFPINSIEETPTFFDSKTFLVAGQKFNLKSLHSYISKKWKDPRTHFALYIGGISSPEIPVAAFSHQNVDKKLTEITTGFINNMNHVKIKTRSKMVLLPEFMDWYSHDFKVKNKQDFLPFINQYRATNKKIPASYTVDFYPYSWKLE
jgi:hypothetical protein